jgi:hypothetical protein
MAIAIAVPMRAVTLAKYVLVPTGGAALARGGHMLQIFMFDELRPDILLAAPLVISL